MLNRNKRPRINKIKFTAGNSVSILESDVDFQDHGIVQKSTGKFFWNNNIVRIGNSLSKDNERVIELFL